MDELFMRAPCFGGRGFDSSEDLTLPEREWWTRASAAISRRNVKDSIKLVQESRKGRMIRGFILDEELALLDKEISECMAKYQHGLWIKSTDRLVLDRAEREKLKSTMLIEKELLSSCAASPPIETGVRNHGMTTQLDLQDKSVARTPRSLDHSPIISTDTGMDMNEKTVTSKTQSIEDETESISKTTQLDLQDKAVARTPRSLDHTEIIRNEATVAYKTLSIMDKTASISMTTQLDLQDKAVARTPKSLDHSPVISSDTGMDMIEDTVACKPQSIVGDTAPISIDTPIKIQKEKIGFGKRTRSFIVKIFRSIGSCVCCGRRAAADEC